MRTVFVIMGCLTFLTARRRVDHGAVLDKEVVERKTTFQVDNFEQFVPLNGLRHRESIHRLERNQPVMLAKPPESANGLPDKSSDDNDVSQGPPSTDVEYRVDKADPRGYEPAQEEFGAYYGSTAEWDVATPPVEELPTASGPSGLSRRSALQGSLAAAMAALLADGTQLVAGVVGAAGKLSRAGIMLRLIQVLEFNEAFLFRAAGLTEKQAAKEGINLFTRQQMGRKIANLLDISKLEQIPGCAKAAEKLRDIKRIADTGKGKFSAAEFRSIADKYAQVRQELEVAFKALPSELRTAGQKEYGMLLRAWGISGEEKIIIAEEKAIIAEKARLLELERKAVAEGATVFGVGGTISAVQAFILDAWGMLR